MTRFGDNSMPPIGEREGSTNTRDTPAFVGSRIFTARLGDTLDIVPKVAAIMRL
jgi:hypothetical protein